jgi:hypothetical protein
MPLFHTQLWNVQVLPGRARMSMADVKLHPSVPGWRTIPISLSAGFQTVAVEQVRIPPSCSARPSVPTVSQRMHGGPDSMRCKSDSGCAIEVLLRGPRVLPVASTMTARPCRPGDVHECQSWPDAMGAVNSQGGGDSRNHVRRRWFLLRPRPSATRSNMFSSHHHGAMVRE